jgi:hypothetical protein
VLTVAAPSGQQVACHYPGAEVPVSLERTS